MNSIQDFNLYLHFGLGEFDETLPSQPSSIEQDLAHLSSLSPTTMPDFLLPDFLSETVQGQEMSTPIQTFDLTAPVPAIDLTPPVLAVALSCAKSKKRRFVRKSPAQNVVPPSSEVVPSKGEEIKAKVQYLFESFISPLKKDYIYAWHRDSLMFRMKNKFLSFPEVLFQEKDNALAYVALITMQKFCGEFRDTLSFQKTRNGRRLQKRLSPKKFLEEKEIKLLQLKLGKLYKTIKTSRPSDERNFHIAVSDLSLSFYVDQGGEKTHLSFEEYKKHCENDPIVQESLKEMGEAVAEFKLNIKSVNPIAIKEIQAADQRIKADLASAFP